jgi:hypothetical protein
MMNCCFSNKIIDQKQILSIDIFNLIKHNIKSRKILSNNEVIYISRLSPSKK